MPSGYKTHAKEYVKTLIGKFKCVRKSSMTNLISSIDNVEHPETIFKDLTYNTPITEKEEMGDTFLLCNNVTPFSEEKAYCFDAFTNLLIAIRKAEKSHGIELPEWMDDAAYEKISRISEGEFPYDFVFSYENAIYLISCFGINANRKYQFHNRTIGNILDLNDKMKVPVNYVTVMVVPKKYNEMKFGATFKCDTLIAWLQGTSGGCKFEKHSRQKESK